VFESSHPKAQESIDSGESRASAPVKESQAKTNPGQPLESVLEGPNFTIARHALKSAKTASDDMVSRAHWHAYTSPSTISQETGVPISDMLRSVAKELTDNALDWCDKHGCPGEVTVAMEGTHTIIVTNAGPPWDAEPEKLAQIFSLARGSISSKLWRLPTRGAMGLGALQITGSVASGDGAITISSCNRRTVLRPRTEDGYTKILEVTEIDYPAGTQIRIEVDPAYPADPCALAWAQTAIQLARSSKEPYLGAPSVHWFDADSFWSLLHAVNSGTRLHDFLERFDGCSTRKIKQQLTEGFNKRSLCSALNRQDACELLILLKKNIAPINAGQLSSLGQKAWPGCEGYAIVRDYFEHGVRPPPATIPFVVECWADVDTGASPDDVSLDELTINRSPTISHLLCQRSRGRDVVLGINRRRINLSLPKIASQFMLNITAPFVPVLSGGKLADITPFADAIGKVIEQAVAKAQRSARKKSRSNTDANKEHHEPGKLHRILERAAEREFCSTDELAVLSKDPYRLDSPAGHQLGAWCARMIERFLAPEAKVHLRGLHYLLASAADVRRPDGSLYINTDAMWSWLTETAMKPARWLGYVPFERIVDERNPEPALYLPSDFQVEVERSTGAQLQIPAIDESLPHFTSLQWPVVQPYRIILIGEKTSLRPVLLPIAKEVGGELLLPTGEPSDTMIAELAKRSAADERPSVVLYFSDFDPAGHQMPVSVARKLQAHCDLYYPELNIQLHHVALTLEQVIALDLPSTPLKATEARASRWRETMDHEQTEIDALAALNPDALTAIAREAIRPYYDPTLAERTQEAEEEWRDQCQERLARSPAMADIQAKVTLALAQFEEHRQQLAQLQQTAALLLTDIEPPPLSLPEAEPDDELKPEALFDSQTDFVTTSRRLRGYKDLVNQDED
jgi:hypothetical protein